MCGLAGVLQRGGRDSSEALATVARRMAGTLVHRGPDHGAEWADGEDGIALGFRRLAIVDLSPAGRQPMVSASGRYVIAFNGEVYNAPALRRELTDAGKAPPFRGHSDTEAMLAAIEAWGLEAAVRRFIGMFAFALWDTERRQLSLVRDRFGVKPLYYALTPGGVLFGSELRALRVHHQFAAEIDRGAVALFLRLGYVPAPYTIYTAARKLTPATIMTVPADRPAEPRETRYWSVRTLIEEGIRSPRHLSDEDLTTELDVLLRDAVRIRMEADVPLGVFLSGGIDSSLVAALMQAQSARPIRTFSIGFRDSRLDESPHAEAVAQHLGTEHTNFVVTEADALAVVEELPEIYDEPFADSSQIPTYLVSKLARRDVTVALTGDGGDELFAGYDRYQWFGAFWRSLRTLPTPLRRTFGRTLLRLGPDRLESWHASLQHRLPRRLRVHNLAGKLTKIASMANAASPATMYLGLMSHVAAPARLLRGAAEPATAFTDPSGWPAGADVTQQAMYLDLTTYLPDDLLVKVDRASMAVSLEAREPLLDHRLFELASRLPMSQKIRPPHGKWPLRQVLDRYVPSALVDRPKTGFGVPLRSWLVGPLRGLGEAHLGRTDAPLADGTLGQEARVVWRRLLAGDGDLAGLAWNLLTLAMWVERRGVDTGASADTALAAEIAAV